MSYQNLCLDVRDGVAFVTLDRPAKLNALDAGMIGELEQAISEIAQDAVVRGVIVTGAGERAFAGGADLQQLSRMAATQARAFSERGQLLLDRLECLGKPVVAAVNGYALGGGCELALACHMRIASDTAVFALPDVKLGLICGYGGTHRLTRLVGRGRALELLLSGGRCDATEALRLGLVNRVVFRDRLLDEAETILRRILDNAPLAVRALIEAVNRGTGRPPAEAQAVEAALFAEVFRSDDAQEGIQASLEKRPARFRAR